MKFAFLIMVLSLVSVQGFAQEVSDPFLTFGEPEIQEVNDVSLQSMLPTAAPGEGDWLGDLNEANVAIDQIINMGKKIWEIVEANRPVVHIETDTATALPRGIEAWQQLQGWQVPLVKAYHITYKNLYGMKVVDFSYRVLYTYGGNVGGKGRYLTQVTVIPASLDVISGYTFTMKASVPSVFNIGTMAEPVGAMQVLLNWKVETVVKHHQRTANFYIQGDGVFKDLSAGN